MAKMYPEVFPGKPHPEDPEFVCYQILRKLPSRYRIFYSKRINGGLFGKSECEIDFVVFNGSDVLICLEVKGGLMAYDGVQRQWFQNRRPYKDVIKQATDAAHTLIRALSHEIQNACVDWALCFPDCSLAGNSGALEIHPSQIIDEDALLTPRKVVLAPRVACAHQIRQARRTKRPRELMPYLIDSRGA